MELRRRIHAAPELAHREAATAAAIVGALPIEVTRAAGTGVIARTAGAERAVAVRAELDGLPVEERTGAEHASRNGAMHACGHDVHAAALVALLRAALAVQDRLPAPLMGIFQPSEEAYPSGAQLLVKEGCLDGALRAVVGVHVQPDLPWGSLSIDPGPINAACDSAVIIVEGRAAHGAYPHLGRDPILAISSIIVGLHTLVSRRLDPLHPAVLTVGELHAGTANNIIPPSARASLTLRTHVPADRQTLREMIREVVESTARAHGCNGRIETTEGEPVLYNDAEISARAQMMAPAAGLEVVGPWRSCGSDDFSFLGAVAPIAMAFAGLSGAPGFASQPLHHPEFLPPDEAVAMVARAQAVLYLAAAQA
ncbi:MAG: M20 family metallopeptidase [Solirubrobacteraceae bacterium]